MDEAVKVFMRQALENSIVVWEYLRDNPEVYAKVKLPTALFKLVAFELNNCPLCTMFVGTGCEGCPLDAPDDQYCADFFNWAKSCSPVGRVIYAGRIVDKLKSWQVSQSQRPPA